MIQCPECGIIGTNQTPTDQMSAQSVPAFITALVLGLTIMMTLLNLTVVILFLKTRAIRENSHYNLVAFLSVSDLTLGVAGTIACFNLLIPVSAKTFIPCLLSALLGFGAVFMSLFETFLICVHRFLVSINSVWTHRIFQGKRKYAIYAISWVGVLVFVFTPISPTPRVRLGICDIIEIYGENYHIVFRVYGVLAMVLFITTILLYIATLHNVRKRYMKTFAFQMENREPKREHNRSTNEAATSSMEAATSSVNASRRLKAFESLKVVGIVLLLFTVFTGPYVIYMFMTVFNFQQSVVPIVIVGGLTCINSTLNPLVYSWRIDPLRKKFKILFQKCICFIIWRPNND
jgi:hypothetical protein